MKFLFLFLDGVGLGENIPEFNPFCNAKTPFLDNLLEGNKFINSTPPFHSKVVTFISLDCQLGVEGLPQSATNQATLITGINVPGELGYHYGPKPNQEIVALISRNHPTILDESVIRIEHDHGGNVFLDLVRLGKTVSFINAYPPQYFFGTESHRRNHSVFPLAATLAGIRLRDKDDLFNENALSADLTGQGWLEHLKIEGTPILTAKMAGQRLAALSKKNDFSFFEYWLSDYAGHKQNMVEAVRILEEFDQVLEGLVKSWDLEKDLVLITSDHGNMEDLATRKHTSNHVPGLLIGNPTYRNFFLQSAKTLQDIAPFIYNVFSSIN